MNRNFVVLLFAINVLIITSGGFIAYYDLYMREYSGYTHENTQIIEVEYYPLGYRPTYEYYDVYPKKIVVTRGSWTLDFFQLSIIIMAVVDILWLLSKRQKRMIAG